MAVTRTQFNHLENAASGTTIAASLTGIAAGSLVKVSVRHDGTSTTSVVDDLSVAGVLARGHSEPTDSIRIDVYYFKNYGGGTRTFTATFPAGTGRAIEVEELAGADTVSPLGPVNSANGSSSTAAAGSVTPGVDGAYIVGYEANASFDFAPQSPMVAVFSETTSVSDSSALAQTTNAAVNPTWTSGSAENWAAIAVVFLPGSGGGGGNAPPPRLTSVLPTLFKNRPLGPGNPLLETKWPASPQPSNVTYQVSLDVISVFDPTLVLQLAYQRALPVATGWAVALTEQSAYQRALAVASTFTASLSRAAGYLRALAVSSSFVVALQRGFARTLAVAGTWVAAMTVGRAYARTLPATGTWTATLTRAVGYVRTLAVSGTWTAALTRQASRLKTLAVSGTFAVSLQKGVGKFLGVSSTFTAALTRQVAYQRTLSIAATFAPSLNAKAAHLLALAVAATFAPVLTVGRGFFRTLATANAWALSITRLVTHTYLQTLAAPSTFTVALSRKAGYQRVLAAVSTYAPALVRVAAHPRTLAVVSPMVVVLRRGIAMRIAVASVFVTAVNRGLSRLLAAVSPFVPGVIKSGGGLFFGFLVRILSAFQPRALDSAAFENESLPDAAFEVRRSQ